MNQRSGTQHTSSARLVWFSPLLLAVVLSPAVMQFSTCSPATGDATLSALEVEVLGQNLISAFDSAQRTYNDWLPLSADTAIVSAYSTDPGSQVSYNLSANNPYTGTLDTIDYGYFPVGGGEVTLTGLLPEGRSQLSINVKAPGGRRALYAIVIQVGCSDCDDGIECTTDACDPVVEQCVLTPVADGTACYFGPLPGVCIAGLCEEDSSDPCAGVDCDDGNECTADLCDLGVCSNPNVGPGGACDQDGGAVCDGSGNCAECVDSTQCPAAGECQIATCIDNTCGTANDEDGADCDAGGGTCSGGSCVSGCTVPAPVDATGIPMACRSSFFQEVSTFRIDLLNVTPDDCILAGQPFNVDIDPTITLDTVFLQAAAQTLCDLGTFLTEADVTSAQVSVDAIAGATCTEQLAVLSPVPQTVVLDISIVGSCGSGGVVTVNSGISIPLPPINVPCTAGAAGSEVQICSTGTVPLNITLASPAPPPAYTETYLGWSIGGGAIQEAFACNTSSTTNPPPGQENEIGCILTNPTPSTPNGLSCADEVGDGNVGETPFPTSDCNTADGPPTLPQTCNVFGSATPCIGTCDTVPIGVDPSTVCATFTVDSSGPSPCQNFGGDAECDALTSLCQVGTCNDLGCDGSTAASCCDFADEPDGTSCDAGGGAGSGTCSDGSCIDPP